MTDINAWNAVDDSNNVASPAGWPEGMMPSGVNNSARAMMGSLKRWRDQAQPTVTATGTGNAQVITYPVAPAALVAGDSFTFLSVATNTGPATLQVNAQPAKAINSVLGAPLAGGEMPAGAVVRVYFLGDGTFRLAGDPGAISKSGGTVSGNLTVTGATALNSTLTVGGSANMLGSLSAASCTVTGTLSAATIGVGGAITAASLSTTGDVYAVNLHASAAVTAVAVGVSSSLTIGGATFSHNVLPYADNAASVGQAGQAYSGMWAYGYTTVSDQSVKGDIQPLPPGSLDLVQTIVPHTYVMLTGPDQETRHAGFIAQEVGQALQSAGHVGGYVLDKESGVAGLVYDELVAVLWAAVTELTGRVKQLETALVR